MAPQGNYQLPERGLVSQAAQAFIEAPHVPRSRFVGRKTRVMTFDAAQIVPFHVDEVYPGDHFRFRTHAYVRMSTPLFPLYSEQLVRILWFYSPSRLLWDNFREFMGQQATPTSSIAFTIPQVTSTGNGFAVGSVFDYLGLPTVGQCLAPLSVNVLPARMYRLMFHQWWRDENLVDAGVPTLTGNGPDAESSYPLRRAAKTHGYFESALPWPQKFTAPAALGSQAPVVGLGVGNPHGAAAAGVPITGTPTSGSPTGVGVYPFAINTGVEPFYIAMSDGSAGASAQVFADLSQISVNVLRQSFMVQSLLERDARGGTRYTEIVKSHFGVTSPDARLQRVEFVGQTAFPLGTTPIAQTAPTTGVPLGALGGTTATYGSAECSYAATEHGYIMGVMVVKSEILHQQGIPRIFSRSTRLDFYWPSLAQLGEQAILRKEIYATGQAANDDVVFGYIPRYDELRYMVSDAAGLMRSTAAGNIDEWHMGQQFGSAPVLGETFITDSPPMTRVLAAGAAAAGMQYIAQVVIERDVTRPMPVFGTPASLGRF